MEPHKLDFVQFTIVQLILCLVQLPLCSLIVQLSLCSLLCAVALGRSSLHCAVDFVLQAVDFVDRTALCGSMLEHSDLGFAKLLDRAVCCACVVVQLVCVPVHCCRPVAVCSAFL